MNLSQAVRNAFLILLVMNLFGCGVRVEIEPAPEVPTQKEETASDIVLFRYDPRSVTFRFEQNAQAPKRVSEWAEEIEGELLVANGTYFLEDYEPAGFLVNEGDIVSERRFDRSRSGLLILAPEFQIVDTAQEVMPPPENLTEAAQSYPFLIKNGAPAVAEDSGQLGRRTFIGTDTDGNIYVGIVDREAMTLFELSRRLMDMDVDWNDVMNLDGGPSSGVVTVGQEDRDFDSLLPVPNVIVVSPR